MAALATPGRAACACALLLALAAPAARAQGPDAGPSAWELTVLFAAAGGAVAAIAAYISRDAIMRRRTDYDGGSFRSKEDRDYEKYHSDWGDEAPRGGRGGAGPARGAPDHYAVLGLRRGATAAEIKARYRELAREAHPDRTGDPGSRDRMAEINEAYEALSDPRRRAEYDGPPGAP